MEIKVTIENARVPVTVMSIRGDLDSSTYQAFQAQADELIAGEVSHLLVDFTDLPFISSAGLRALHKDVNDDELHKKRAQEITKLLMLK